METSSLWAATKTEGAHRRPRTRYRRIFTRKAGILESNLQRHDLRHKEVGCRQSSEKCRQRVHIICCAGFCGQTQFEHRFELEMQMPSRPTRPPVISSRPYSDPTVAWLVATYGPLLRHIDVAKLLNRSPGSLRDCISRYPSEPAYAALRAARRRIGRHVLYDSRIVGPLIDGTAVTEAQPCQEPQQAGPDPGPSPGRG